MRIFLSFSATLCMPVIYAVKAKANLIDVLPFMLLVVSLAAVSVAVAILTLRITYCLEKDNMYECTSFILADNDFLPVYLGYFFVALSIDDIMTFLFVYSIVFLFVFLSDAYFNPLFILFGYHYYRVITKENVQLFVICKSLVRDTKEVAFDALHRINNFTYISHGGSDR